MIAALLRSDQVVRVEDVTKPEDLPPYVEVSALDRLPLTQHYIGGVGWVDCLTSFIPLDALECAVYLDPETCEPLQNWQDAMHDTDLLADQHSWATRAAIEAEERARLAFVNFIHSLSVARQPVKVEITPNFPIRNEITPKFDFSLQEVP